LVGAPASRLAPLARPDRLPPGLERLAPELGRFLASYAEPPRRWPVAGGSVVSLDHPVLIGIVNVTPDSFSDGGRFATVDRAVAQAERLVAEGGAGVIVMHMRGTPDTMDSLAVYGQVAADVAAELGAAAARAEAGGVARERIVVDPGFGFSKTPEQNFRLLDELATVVGLGYPVAVGPSRKRFLGAATGRPVEDRDRATAVACALAWERGARLFRVHDAGVAREALRVAGATTSPN